MTTDQAIKILNGAIKKPNTKDGYLGQAMTMAINALKNQSEIIRCKDCKWYDEAEDWSPQGICIRYSGIYPSNAFYCADAELRGDSE